jgi:uncharacterized protein YjbI with pentapeptide repeats
MAQEEHLAILKQGVEDWNQWRAENPEIQPDLSRVNFWSLEPGDPHLMEALWNVWFPDPMAYNLRNINFQATNLRGVCLSCADLRGARLQDADLCFADLRQASLDQADLRGAKVKAAKLNGLQAGQADLSDADLENSDLSGAYLYGANLSQANLKGVNFTGATLDMVNMTGATLQWSLLVDVDLCSVQGLDTVRHYGHSSVGMDTIHRAQGQIPEVFLQGCGLSPLEIEYAKLANPVLDQAQLAAITENIQHVYSSRSSGACYISYDEGDQEFYSVLFRDLQNQGIRCWRIPPLSELRDPLRPALDRQRRLRNKLLVILSTAAVENEWIGDEVEAALQEEEHGNRLILVPVRLDDVPMHAPAEWVANIRRSRPIEDFTNWKDRRRYEQALQQLVRKLRIPDST